MAVTEIPAPDLLQLLATPPAQFVAARDALAARYKAQGNTQAMRATKALKKPAAAMWVLNALARKAAPAVHAWADTVARLREMQAGGAPDALKDAIKAQRAAVADLVERAETLAAGLPSATVPKVRELLRVLGQCPPETVAQFAAATLTHEPVAHEGGDEVARTPAPKPEPTAPAQSTGAAPAPDPAALQQAAAQREKERQAEWDAAQRLASEHDAAAVQAEQEAARLATEADNMERAARNGRRRADEATHHAQEARALADEARRWLGALDKP